MSPYSPASIYSRKNIQSRCANIVKLACLIYTIHESHYQFYIYIDILKDSVLKEVHLQKMYA